MHNCALRTHNNNMYEYVYFILFLERERERKRGSILQTSLEGSDEYQDLKWKDLDCHVCIFG